MSKNETRASKRKAKEASVSEEEKIDVSKYEKKIAELENSLIKSERQSLGLFELTNDAIFLISIDGYYLEVNQKAAEMLGYNRHDIIGRHMLDFIADNEKDDSKRIFSDLKTGRILPIYTRYFKRRDGSIFPAEINAAVVQDDEGNPAYVQSAVRDISERIDAERALERERKAYNHITEALIFTEGLKDFCERCLPGLTDTLGFDAISIGGTISWLMECISDGLIKPDELGIKEKPVFEIENFHAENDSLHNANVGIDIMNSIIERKGILDLSEGTREFARKISNERDSKIIDRLVFTGNTRRGWMIPNQYWTPGALSPMAIMGKYYMYYGQEFFPPRNLGRINADRFRVELMMDNLGMCRFHRLWAEEMLPEIIGSLYGLKEEFLQNIAITASRINSRNASTFWESERNIDFVYTFLKRQQTIEDNNDEELTEWIQYFERDKKEART